MLGTWDTKLYFALYFKAVPVRFLPPSCGVTVVCSATLWKVFCFLLLFVLWVCLCICVWNKKNILIIVINNKHKTQQPILEGVYFSIVQLHGGSLFSTEKNKNFENNIIIIIVLFYSIPFLFGPRYSLTFFLQNYKEIYHFIYGKTAKGFRTLSHFYLSKGVEPILLPEYFLFHKRPYLQLITEYKNFTTSTACVFCHLTIHHCTVSPFHSKLIHQKTICPV